MSLRHFSLSISLVVLALSLSSCKLERSNPVTAVHVDPGAASVTAIQENVQFKATGVFQNGTTRDVTGEVAWQSSNQAVATVNSSGLATTVGSGVTSIVATLNTSSGPVSGSASLNATLAGGSGARTLTSVSIIPSTQTLNTLSETAQFIAIGTYSAAPTTVDLAGKVSWVSSDTRVATIDQSSGLATAVGCGASSCVTTITASATESNLTVIGTATLTVNPGLPQPTRTLSAITIIPGAGTQTLNTIGETAQFIAIGTWTASPITTDLTADPYLSWGSSAVNIATINASGLATVVSCNPPTPQNCKTIITAQYQKLPTDAVITGVSDLTVNPVGGGPNLPSLSVYLVGAGTGTVTSTPAGINCSNVPGSTGEGCSAAFPVGTSVTLTATQTGFGGWSSNCQPSTASTCTVLMGGNQTVGAIFNIP